MQDAMDRLTWLKTQVDQMWNGSVAAEAAGHPALNLWDDGENFHVEAELPGFRIEDIDLAIAGAELQIRGQRAFQAKEGWRIHRQERPSGEFSRTIRFAAEIDAGKVEAALKDGVLRVRLPKAPSAKPRKIQVKLVGPKK